MAANYDTGTPDDTSDDYFRLNIYRSYFQLKNGLTASPDPSQGRENTIRAFVLNFSGGNETQGISLTPAPRQRARRVVTTTSTASA